MPSIKCNSVPQTPAARTSTSAHPSASGAGRSRTVTVLSCSSTAALIGSPPPLCAAGSGQGRPNGLGVEIGIERFAPQFLAVPTHLEPAVGDRDIKIAVGVNP